MMGMSMAILIWMKYELYWLLQVSLYSTSRLNCQTSTPVKPYQSSPWAISTTIISVPLQKRRS